MDVVNRVTHTFAKPRDGKLELFKQVYIILEIHLVREHSFADGKGRSQVLAEELLLRVLLQSADQLTINFDLILLALFRDDVSGLLLLEDFAFSVTNLLCLGPTEIFVVHGLRDIYSGYVDLCLGGNDVIWLILLSGHLLMRKGPVTSKSPEANCFKKTTRFPLWTPANRIKTVPGVMVERNLRLCWLKGFLLEAFLCLRVCVGRARGILFSWTTRLSPFFSQPISLVTVAAFLTAGAFAAVLFFTKAAFLWYILDRENLMIPPFIFTLRAACAMVSMISLIYP